MKTLLAIVLALCSLPAFAAPVCMTQDATRGIASGGEGGNGTYLRITGTGFGSTRGASTVTVNGTAAAQYLQWGPDNTGDRQVIGIQLAAGTTTGVITVNIAGVGSCSPGSLTIGTGHILFVGNVVDNTAPVSCATMIAANSYSTPWGFTSTASNVESTYNTATMRTPLVWYNCMNDGDWLVWLNGASYQYFDGGGWHASLTIDDSTATSTSYKTIASRPGATATLGGSNYYGTNGMRSKINQPDYTHVFGMTLIGTYNAPQNSSGSSIISNTGDRVVGNTMQCAACDGQSAAFDAGGDNVTALNNFITNVSTDTSILPNGSDKQFHAAYFQGNGEEFGWNRISVTAAYNGFQIHHDTVSGFYNISVHDNDIADVNGSGINFSAIDPSLGYVKAYNNVIHHTGVSVASDGGTGDPHSCIAVKGNGTSTGVGIAQVYNNTMFDCNSYLNTENSNADCAVLLYNGQPSVTTNLVNNTIYQPGYTNTGSQNVYLCAGGGTLGPRTGSNNIWYSATTPGSTTPATTYGTITNPLYVSATNGSWTNYELQSGSPARGAGTATLYPTLDFLGATRPNPPAIGFAEYFTVAPPTGFQVTPSFQAKGGQFQ